MVLDQLVHNRMTRLDFIDPGEPVQNAYVESILDDSEENKWAKDEVLSAPESST